MDASILNNIRVASPCPAAWDRMEGDDRARFCRECGKHVYNLSEMSRKEAEALIREKEGRLCVRFYRRRDGTVMTDNCPVGLRTLRRALLFQVGLIGTVFAACPGIAAVLVGHRWREWGIWQHEPLLSFAVRAGIIPRPNPFAMNGEVSIVVPSVPPKGAGGAGPR